MIKKNVGIIGNGKWAKIMIPKIKKLANIKFIANTKTGFKDFYLGNVSWIFVLTNNDTHYKIVKYFLDKRKKVFCEKPLTKNFKNILELYDFSKKKKTKLYVNDVEYFKKKNFLIKKNNTIIRTKKSEISKESLLHRLAYHDFYLLKNFINLENIEIKNYYENKKKLSIRLFSDNKMFKFNYDINSKIKKHRINDTNMMDYKKDPLDLMLKYVLKNDNLKYIQNFSNSFFAGKLISIINNKFC